MTLGEGYINNFFNGYQSVYELGLLTNFVKIWIGKD